MVGTRGRKRAAEPTEEPAAAVTLEQVLAAVDACRAAILQHAATISTSQVLELCREQMGLPDVVVLRSHRQAAKERALQLLEEQGQRPAAAAPPSAADLPLGVLVEVFNQFDHDSLFCALQCCRGWRAAGEEPAVWEQLFSRRDGLIPHPLEAAMQQQQVQHDPEEGRQPRLQSPPPSPQQPRQRYRQRYSRSCYDCFKPTERSTLQAGSLRLRLCRDCSEAYDSPRPHHRLVAASTAKRQYCLRDKDLAPLRKCVERNPINPAWKPMHLYRRLDVRRAAIERWGSWESVAAEHRRRITRY